MPADSISTPSLIMQPDHTFSYDPEDPDLGSHYAALLLGVVFAGLSAACCVDYSTFATGVFAGIFGAASVFFFILAHLFM